MHFTINCNLIHFRVWCVVECSFDAEAGVQGRGDQSAAGATARHQGPQQDPRHDQTHIRER